MIDEEMETEKTDNVNHPKHYKLGNCEVIDITEQLNFNRGNAVKYICRAGRKLDECEDLLKALWYVKRELKRIGYVEKQQEKQNEK